MLRVTLRLLALVGLHQPVTRPGIDAVRGVSLPQGSMDALLEAGLIRLVGRPTLRAATPRFLAQFGLRDLPGAGLLLTGSRRAGEGVAPAMDCDAFGDSDGPGAAWPFPDSMRQACSAPPYMR